MTTMTAPEDTGEHEAVSPAINWDHEASLLYGRHSANEEAREENLTTGRHTVDTRNFREPAVSVADLRRRLELERLATQPEAYALLSDAEKDDVLDAALGNSTVLLKPYRPDQAEAPDDTVGMLALGPRPRKFPLRVVSAEDAAIRARPPITKDALNVRGTTDLTSLDLNSHVRHVFLPDREDRFTALMNDIAENHKPQPNPWQRVVTRIRSWLS